MHASGSSLRPRVDPQPAARRVGDDPAVALGAHGARPGHDRVDGQAQRVEQLAVGAAAERPRAPAERGAAVGGADHVEHHVRALARRRRSRRRMPVDRVQPEAGHDLRRR